MGVRTLPLYPRRGGIGSLYILCNIADDILEYVHKVPNLTCCIILYLENNMDDNNFIEFVRCFVFFCIIVSIILIIGFCSITKNIKKISNQLEIIKMEVINEK